MNKKNVPQRRNPESDLHILREVHNNPNLSQRDLAKNLDMSLGKLNYCLKALKSKGLIKIKNFSKNKNRFNPKSKNNYFYILTPKGLNTKTRLTLNFMERKMKEYEQLKKEVEVKNKSSEL